jgi:PKD repeat protein
MTSRPIRTSEDYEIEQYDPNPISTSSFDSLPPQFSWRNYGGDWTTPARDQASCGSCYIFSPVSAIESAINIASGYPTTDIDLSEQYGLSCVNNGCYGCGGGWGNRIMEAIYSTDPGQSGNGINGIPVESCMPYQAVDYIPCSNKCEDWDYYTDPPQPDNKLWQLDDWGWTDAFSEDNPSDWNTMKNWLLDYGPLCIDIYASSSWSNYFDTHHSPTDVYEQDDPGITNHEVLLVGWVDDDTILNGGYWILKNSWGPSWGYSGFFNIAYGCNSLGEDIVCWARAMEWPEDIQGPGPGRYEIHVFSDFEYEPKYPHLGEEIQFTDTSDGPVTLREWDFNGDGIIDSQAKRPKWSYMQDGDYNVNLTVWSSVGLNSTRTKIVGAREIWPPKAIASPEYYSDNKKEIYFEGRLSHDLDGGTITRYLWDFDDGTTSNERYVTHNYIEGDRIYNVTLTVTDNDGSSDTAHCDIRIDINIPPVTKAINEGVTQEQEWYGNTQRISFEATDWTSVRETFYRIEEGNWIEYEDNIQRYITISQEGLTTIDFYSIDYYGNEEEVKSKIIKIDKTSPSLDINLIGIQNQDYYIGTVTVELSGTDDLSGVQSILYKFGMHGWTEYTEPFKIEGNIGGTIRLDYMAVDNSGNSVVKLIEISLEPAPTNPKIKGSSSGIPNTEYEFTFVSTDHYPADDQIWYYITWGDGSNTGWIGPYASGETVTLKHTWETQGNFVITAKAKDKYDAISEESTIPINIPKTIIWFNLFQKIINQFPIIEKIIPILFQNSNLNQFLI